MKNHTPKLNNVIEIDEARIRDHLGELVRGSVEDTLNTLLDAEADWLCNATRYERTVVAPGPGGSAGLYLVEIEHAVDILKRIVPSHPGAGVGIAPSPAAARASETPAYLADTRIRSPLQKRGSPSNQEMRISRSSLSIIKFPTSRLACLSSCSRATTFSVQRFRAARLPLQ